MLENYMKQNKYDDPAFFARYSEMARSVGGLQTAAEWPAFRGLLPDLRDKRVLDLGCGFGWHCRYACEQGARSVVGADLSEKMLQRVVKAIPRPSDLSDMLPNNPFTMSRCFTAVMRSVIQLQWEPRRNHEVPRKDRERVRATPRDHSQGQGEQADRVWQVGEDPRSRESVDHPLRGVCGATR